MRLLVGSVVFVSHRRKRVVFRVAKFWAKNTSQGREDFFAKPERLDLAKS